MDRVDRVTGVLGEAHGRLEREIHGEKAAALARIARTLSETLAALDAAPPGRDRRALLRQARLFRWYLEVQREAVGLHRHEDLDVFYPVPGEETA
jgi:hypothetical protein